MDIDTATGKFQDGIEEVEPLIRQIANLSKDRCQYYRLTHYSRKYRVPNADYPWMVKDTFVPILSSDKGNRDKLPKGQYTKDQVIGDLVKHTKPWLDKYSYSENRDHDTCAEIGTKLYDQIQDLLDVVNDDTNRFEKDSKGNYHPITYYNLNSHDVNELRAVYPKIKDTPYKIDH